MRALNHSKNTNNPNFFWRWSKGAKSSQAMRRSIVKASSQNLYGLRCQRNTPNLFAVAKSLVTVRMCRDLDQRPETRNSRPPNRAASQEISTAATDRALRYRVLSLALCPLEHNLRLCHKPQYVIRDRLIAATQELHS